MDEPFLAAQPNFRDLGGIRGAGGRRLRTGTVFRSGELSRLPVDDIGRLDGLGIRTIVDLRSDHEIEERGTDHLPDGASLVRLPIGEADRLQAELTARFARGEYAAPDVHPMDDVYRALVRDWLETFAAFLHLAAEAAVPLVVHCTHGKDRAGLATALLLLALGVEWSAIEDDYLESNTRRRIENDQRISMITAMVEDRTGGRVGGAEIAWMRGLFVVDPRYLAAARRELEARCGDTAGILADGLGLDDRRLAGLRDRFLL